MVSSIGSTTVAQATATQAAPTRTEERTPDAAPTAGEAAGTAGATDDSVETLSALSSATARVGNQLRAQADASRVQPAASSELEATDYIAEADTNSDKKVSDQERIAYEKKLEQQAAAKAPQDRSAEVQMAYGLADEAEPAVATSA
ncbi:hypothetical protein [Massilia yuzhufengensis]|uniref:Uncharacterized protein n=1 Tax=Massilia yuzhufengensis TaxID=1164594 RepID=A0A1I1LR90_9BURK|nr:hypothetical protein [Massilia yuzhufengensis]SFC71970.1 hypothetical protein SAMN05216204_10981 [Massilia yuzhufengensis]